MVKSGKVLSLQIPILFVITFLKLNNDVLTTIQQQSTLKFAGKDAIIIWQK